MRTLPSRAAKQRAFCTKCDETHDKPVGRQCLQFATTSAIMGDSDDSSISSIPLGQCDQASTQKIVSDGSPDKLDIILKHIQRLDDELKEVKKDRHEILKACASKNNPISSCLSPPRPGYRPPTYDSRPLPCPVSSEDDLELTTRRGLQQNALAEADDLVIPSMNFLRDNSQLRRKVDTRMQQWEDQQRLDVQGKKLKSGLHRHQEGHVLVNVNWPHKFCFSQDRSCPAYDDLSQMQFTQGFIGCVLEESDVNIRQNMLQYLQQLIQDAQETNWFTAKSAHKVLLIEMERGKISWKDVRLIHQMRAKYTQRTIYPGQCEKFVAK